jgi:hypothetical protein
MLRGAYEAIYQGTPVIVSNWPILRASFPYGAVHVDNTPEGIAQGVREMRANLDTFRTDAIRLREVKMSRWEGTRRSIVARLAGHSAPRDRDQMEPGRST